MTNCVYTCAELEHTTESKSVELSEQCQNGELEHTTESEQCENGELEHTRGSEQCENGDKPKHATLLYHLVLPQIHAGLLLPKMIPPKGAYPG